MSIAKLLGSVVAIAFASGAQAAYVVVDDLGGPVIMNAGSFSGLPVPGSELFQEDEMATVHNALNLAGVQTDGYVTFLLANTDAGLTFMTLVDSNVAGPLGGMPSSLGMTTTAPDTLDGYVNAEPDDPTNWPPASGGLQVFQELFNWQGASEGDGFAWGNIVEGDAVAYHFTDFGTEALNPDAPFQFLSYNGMDWDVVADGDFTVNDQFVFSFTAVPAPGVMALLALAGLTASRRRR